MPNAIALLAALPTNTLSSEYFLAVFSLGWRSHILLTRSFVLFKLRKKTNNYYKVFIMQDTQVKDALPETLIIDSGGFEECIFVLIDFGMGIFCSMQTLLHYPCTYLVRLESQ